jgi:dienelactone hydrolase
VRATLFAIASALWALLPVPTWAAERVSLPADGLTLSGELFRPAGPGPFPAVVALHGCSGLYNRNGSLNPRHADWGERLARAGFIVLLPDSFGSRGLGSQCSVHDREVRPSAERVSDALSAKTYLQARSDVKGEAVSLLGWSNGGSAVLYATSSERRARKGPDFARAVAFYPGCRVPLQSGRWTARFPLLILIGAEDSWTPAQPCEDLAREAQSRGEPVSITVYPHAVHDFDHPNLSPRERAGLAYTGDNTGVARVGTDPDARADAISRVPQFLLARAGR